MILFISCLAFGQVNKEPVSYYAGFKTVKLTDTSRIYKPNSTPSDSLHYRPVELDIWYPSLSKGSKNLVFKDFFISFEQRANLYQEGKNYTGLTEELAQFYAIESGLDANAGNLLLLAETNSYKNLIPANNKFPVIIYLAGFNGMGFENFKILEKLAERGFIVVSVWSVGRYPGDMTNRKEDMLEQVYDAEFAIQYLKSQNDLFLNFENMGVLGCSWGGMSASVLISGNPDLKAFVSLDGSETSYFGDSNDDDTYLNEIYLSGLLRPENSSVNYLYLESGNKLETYTPTREFHFFKKLSTEEKYYLRFLKSEHEDFTSIPSTLQASKDAIGLQNQISDLTVLFFENYLKKIDGFKSIYDKLSFSEDTSTVPYEIDYKRTDQALVRGEIIDAKTGSMLPFVSIGILNKEMGTVSKDDGKFELNIGPGMEDGLVRVSMIGYKAKTISVQELLSKQWNSIELEEEINQLPEVVITARGLKRKNLGNKTTSKYVSTGFGYEQLGSEIGIKIDVRKQPVFVDAFNFNIPYNRLSARALFRLNLYEIEGGMPAKNILTKSIIIPIDAKQTGLISVDLTPYTIVLRDDVIASLEWINNEGENNKGEAIYFSLGVFNSGTLIKRSSQGRFKKHSNMGVGFNFDVRY